MKDKAIKSKKIVTLNSMPPKDRRIIHQYFSEDEEIETKSHGESYYKRIKLVPFNLEKRPRKEEHVTSPTEDSNQPVDTENTTATEEHEANGNVAAPESKNSAE